MGDLSAYIKKRGMVTPQNSHPPSSSALKTNSTASTAVASPSSTSPSRNVLAHGATDPMVNPLAGPWGGLNEFVVRHYLRQLASALEFLRSNSLIHRDLKPQNLLLNPAPENASAIKLPSPFRNGQYTVVPALPVLKLADFGFARALPQQSLASTLCGSPLYMAPEILRGDRYDAKADLWSVGAVLYDLLRRIDRGEGIIRFPGEDQETASRKSVAQGGHHVGSLGAGVSGGTFSSSPRGGVSNLPVGSLGSSPRFPMAMVGAIQISDDLKDLIRKLLKRNPVERMTFEEFFLHPAVISNRALPGVGMPEPLVFPSSRSGGGGNNSGTGIGGATVVGGSNRDSAPQSKQEGPISPGRGNSHVGSAHPPIPMIGSPSSPGAGLLSSSPPTGTVHVGAPKPLLPRASSESLRQQMHETAAYNSFASRRRSAQALEGLNESEGRRVSIGGGGDTPLVPLPEGVIKSHRDRGSSSSGESGRLNSAAHVGSTVPALATLEPPFPGYDIDPAQVFGNLLVEETPAVAQGSAGAAQGDGKRGNTGVDDREKDPSSSLSSLGSLELSDDGDEKVVHIVKKGSNAQAVDSSPLSAAAAAAAQKKAMSLFHPDDGLEGQMYGVMAKASDLQFQQQQQQIQHTGLFGQQQMVDSPSRGVSGLSGRLGARGALPANKASFEEYVVVEKRVVEVNWLADEVAASTSSSAGSNSPSRHAQGDVGGGVVVPVDVGSLPQVTASATGSRAGSVDGLSGGGGNNNVSPGYGRTMLSGAANALNDLRSSTTSAAMAVPIVGAAAAGAGAALARLTSSVTGFAGGFFGSPNTPPSPRTTWGFGNRSNENANPSLPSVGGVTGASPSSTGRTSRGVNAAGETGRVFGSLRESTHNFLDAAGPPLVHGAGAVQGIAPPTPPHQHGFPSPTQHHLVGMQNQNTGTSNDSMIFYQQPLLQQQQQQQQPQTHQASNSVTFSGSSHSLSVGIGGGNAAGDDDASLLTTINLCAIRGHGINLLADERYRDLVAPVGNGNGERSGGSGSIGAFANVNTVDAEVAASTGMQMQQSVYPRVIDGAPTDSHAAEEALNLYLTALGLYQLGIEAARAVWSREQNRIAASIAGNNNSPNNATGMTASGIFSGRGGGRGATGQVSSTPPPGNDGGNADKAVTPGTTMANVNLTSLSASVQWIRERFNECLERAEEVRGVLGDAEGSGLDGVVGYGARPVERIVYEKALEISRAAALAEANHSYSTAEAGYTHAVLLLEAILYSPPLASSGSVSDNNTQSPVSDGTPGLSDSDRVVLERFISSLGKRIEKLKTTGV
ncbi:Serine/threonine-protein kinase [Blyttiomyces sp. JEL0837]|nr:Serine/threonine-protein kinase [Blyttiomyces sp. JEL0837]